MSRTRVGVLVSGRGSNLQALMDAAVAADAPYEIAVVVSNRPDAYALERARAADIPAHLVDHRGFARDREAFERALDATLRAEGAEFLALAGFMRVLTPWFVRAWAGRMINIHPSLLPLFPGLNTHARALAAGMRVHGCTVHYVSEGVDEGPIIGQAVVPVMAQDTPDILAARVVRAEHALYPRALALATGGEGAGAAGDAMLLNAFKSPIAQS